MSFLNNPPGATPLDPDDLLDLIPKHVATREQLDQIESLNILRSAVWSTNQRWSSEKLLKSSTLRRIHKEMFGYVWRWAGKYRLRETSIGIAPEQIAVQLEQLVHNVQFRIRVESETDIQKEILAQFHHQLVVIHPFPNGNGRHSRFVTEILAACIGVELPRWGAGNLFADNLARVQYLEALRIADATGSTKELIKFMWD